MRLLHKCYRIYVVWWWAGFVVICRLVDKSMLEDDKSGIKLDKLEVEDDNRGIELDKLEIEGDKRAIELDKGYEIPLINPEKTFSF